MATLEGEGIRLRGGRGPPHRIESRLRSCASIGKGHLIEGGGGEVVQPSRKSLVQPVVPQISAGRAACGRARPIILNPGVGWGCPLCDGGMDNRGLRFRRG
jgi:hypothetical protein